jgi:hypothetical protein
MPDARKNDKAETSAEAPAASAPDDGDDGDDGDDDENGDAGAASGKKKKKKKKKSKLSAAKKNKLELDKWCQSVVRCYPSAHAIPVARNRSIGGNAGGRQTERRI